MSDADFGDDEQEWITLCLDCDAQFGSDEEGHGYEECIECGGVTWSSRMIVVDFDVIGIPAPQGSKRHVGKGIMVESSKALPVWRDALTAAARAEAVKLGGPLTGPLKLSILFRFPMPKSRPAAARAAGYAKKTTAPDLDKLVRAVGDALTQSGLIGDDAQIAALVAAKGETLNGWTGAAINVRQL